MKLKLALSVVLSITFTGVGAEARSQLHLYSAVPVAGDPVLEIAYRAALDRCNFEIQPSYERTDFYGYDYGAADLRSCLSRKGFTSQNGEPFAYPISVATYPR